MSGSPATRAHIYREAFVLLNHERALDVMDRHQVDAIVAALPENVYYLSDYGASHSFSLSVVGISAVVFPRDEQLAPTLIVAEFELPYLLDSPTWMPQVRLLECLRSRISSDVDLTPGEQKIVEQWSDLRQHTSSTNRQSLIAALLTEAGLSASRVVFDDGRVMAEVRELLPELVAVEGVNIIREIKIIKTADEIKLLRRAAQVNEAALGALVAAAIPGTMMRELKRVWFTAMAAQGAVGVELPLAGLDRPWQMYADTTYRLQPGDHLNVDVAGTLDRYWADTGRTVTVDTPSAKVEELFALLEECHAKVVPNLRPGVTTGEIVGIAADSVRTLMPEGFAPVVHSIGNEVYDQPATYGSLYSDSFMLEADMVINFESLYFEYPWGALQLENTYYLGQAGVEQLTCLPNGPLSATG